MSHVVTYSGPCSMQSLHDAPTARRPHCTAPPLHDAPGQVSALREAAVVAVAGAMGSAEALPGTGLGLGLVYVCMHVRPFLGLG